MRALLVLMLLPTLAFAQSAEEKKATIQYLEGLRDKETGAFKNTPKDKPSLRATNGTVKALKALGEKVADNEKIQKFVLSRYDAKTGAFSEPDGKPDATITSIGIIVACEVGIEKENLADAPGYLMKNAKNFEEVRIAAAAVEAWGLKDPIWKPEAFPKVVRDFSPTPVKDPQDGYPREFAASIVTLMRLGTKPLRGASEELIIEMFMPGQCDDGGWRKKGEKSSDIESTYRVMRAFKMLEQRPLYIAKLREFIASHRNKDGGYATKPGEASSASGTYFAVIISKWLDDMEK